MESSITKPKLSQVIKQLLAENPLISLSEVKEAVKEQFPDANDRSISTIYYRLKKGTEKEEMPTEKAEEEKIEVVSEEKITIPSEAVAEALFKFANFALERLSKSDKVPFAYEQMDDDEIEQLVELWTPVLDQYLQTEETKLGMAVMITISMFITHIKPKVAVEIREESA